MIPWSLSPAQLLPGVRAFDALASRSSAAFCLMAVSAALSGVAHAQTDTTPPTATLGAPTANSHIADLSGGISGTATDAGTGVASMTVRLSRNFPNVTTQYWNGSSWQSGSFNLAVQLGTANGSGTKNWNVTTTLPTGSDFSPGRYAIFYQAKDGANLNSTSQTPYVYSGTDTTAPTLALTTPTPNAVYDASVFPATISGTVQDPANGDSSAGSGVTSVTLRMQRTYNGFTEYWDGSTSAWVTSTSYVATATVGSPDGSGVCSWSVTPTLPSGADLPTGVYSFFIQCTDRSNNGSFIVPNVKIGPNDTTAPTGSLASPDSTTNLSSLPTTWSGLVWDPANPDSSAGSGVVSARVRLWRNWSGGVEYWSGTSWGGPDTTFATTLGSTNGSGQTAWTATPPLPTGTDLPDGHYTVGIAVRDRYGNAVNVNTQISVGTADTTAPTVAVTSPTEGQTLTSLSSITGTASDSGSGVGRVDVSLCRSVTISGVPTTQYWNGSAWGTSTSYLATRTELGWTRNTGLPSGANLPAGDYFIVAKSYDHYGNVSSTVTRNFSIVGAPTLAVTPLDGSATLSWDVTAGDVNYSVKRSSVQGGPYTTLTSSLTTGTYTDTGLSNGTTYYYVVTVTDSLSNESANSNEVNTIPSPWAPLKLTGDAGDGHVSLGWTANSSATSYKVYKDTTSGPVLLTTTTDQHYTVSSLTNNTDYEFHVIGWNGGTIALSNHITLTPQIGGVYNGVDDVTWTWSESITWEDLTGNGTYHTSLPIAGPEAIIIMPSDNVSTSGIGHVHYERFANSEKVINWFWDTTDSGLYPAPSVATHYIYAWILNAEKTTSTWANTGAVVGYGLGDGTNTLASNRVFNNVAGHESVSDVDGADQNRGRQRGSFQTDQKMGLTAELEVYSTNSSDSANGDVSSTSAMSVALFDPQP